MSLLQKCIDQDSSACLYITCNYLLNGNINILEDEWINISSLIGMNKKLIFGKLWCEVNEELLTLLQCDNLNVQDALLMTSKLYILNSRLFENINNKNVATNIRKIRSEIIDYFPETAALSYEGIKMYRQILPSQTSDNYMFFSRILASFSRLFESYIENGEESKQDDIRNAMEYISRKKNEMILPSDWPLNTLIQSVSHKQLGIADPIWFLWGMLLSYFSDKKVATNFQIFSWNYKKSIKNNRIGLLWGLSYCLKNNLTYSWTPDEIKILQKVIDMAPELWKDVREKHKLEEQEELLEEEESNNSTIFNFNTYMPRSNDFINENSNENNKNIISHCSKKAVSIKNK
jgi:hypothetical protein